MSSADAACVVDGITFAYPGSQTALFRDFSIAFERGQIVSIMGPSGCGKSTFSKLLGRILHATVGEVRWREEFTPPHEVIYSDQLSWNAVFPWLTVGENLRWPLRKRKWAKAAIEARVERLLNLFRLEHLRDQLPRDVSGGELQRLAVARCLTWQPKALILDEALSSLDRATKELVIHGLREEARSHLEVLILITHNLTEVMSIADRCLIFGENGKRLVADRNVALPFPRTETSPEYAEAQEALLDVLKRGLI